MSSKREQATTNASSGAGNTKQQSKTQQQRRDETSAAVLDSACKLFGEYGYQKTSLEDIAKDCGTTIRPIYHYYGNKKNLFLAVVEAKEAELFQSMLTLEAQAKAEASSVSVSAYWKSFMAFGRDAGFRQVVLVDSPAILGRERWAATPILHKAIDYFYGLYPVLQETSRQLIARMLVAALVEAAMVLSEAGEPEGEPAFDDIFALFDLMSPKHYAKP